MATDSDVRKREPNAAAYRAEAGGLKLACSQFEGLETLPPFGCCAGADNRNVVEHELRIRACLRKPEFAPVQIGSPTEIKRKG